MVRLPCGSRSTRSTLIPCSAKATPRFNAVVVLATPPFWLAKAMTLPSVAPFEMSSRVPGRGSRRASPIRPFLSSDSSRTLYRVKCRRFSTYGMVGFQQPGLAAAPRMSARPFWSASQATPWCSGSFLFGVWKYELEACTARLDRLVDQIAALGSRKRLRNREAEPGALGALCRLLAAREPLEQLRHELGTDAAPAVLHREPEMPVRLLALDPHRGIAVAKCVRDQVRDDPVEGGEIRDRFELRRDDQLDSRCMLGHQGRDELLDMSSDLNRLGTNPDRLCLEAGKIEQVVDELPQAVAVVVEDAAEIADLLVFQLTAAQVQRGADPVDDGRGGSQLVRGERDEVRLQLVEAAKLLLREGALEERGHQGADRPQQLRGV